MKERSQLIRLCVSSLEEKGLAQNEAYKQRLKAELKEIDAQAEHEYLLNLHNEFRLKNLILPENEHNNLVDWLLNIAPDFDINKPNTWIQGEFPDIDIDYLKPVRDYLKGEWAAENYGQENICEIGTYGTAGIKSSILDMARVHGADIHQIQSITSQLEDKDDDGKPLEWDKIFEIATFQICSKEEQEEIKQELERGEIDWANLFALKHKLNGIGTVDTSYVKFAVYCLENPEIAQAAKLFQGRNTHSGVHAGGLIVSSQRLDGFVPLEVRKVNKENPNGVICSAWSEGLAHQDLAPVGLIKFDLLVINNLMQIAMAVDLIKKRHGLLSICAREGDTDWSDTSYLNDPKAIDMANKADLRCIFQFDGEGIRKLVKRGGVTSFEDLVAYSALYRPGPLNMGMDARYCKRKKWADGDRANGEPYSIHPIMEKSLGKTYGVLVYQEQVMDMLRVVGLIPDMHTEKVRKAISKKKIAQFSKYKEQFIINGQKVLGCNEEFVVDLWDQIEAFAEYGFNRSVLKSTIIPYKGGEKQIQDFKAGDIVYCVNEDGETVETEVVALHDHGELEGFEVTFDDGYQITCSANHKFLTEKGQVSLREICRTRSYIFATQNIWSDYVKSKERRVEDIVRNAVSQQEAISQSSNELQGLQRKRIAKKASKIEKYRTLWNEIVNQERSSSTSSELRSMQGNSLGMCNARITLWNEIQNLERKGDSSSRVRPMQEIEREKYSNSNGETQQGQRASRSQKDIFGDCTQDIGTTRDSGSTCCESQKVEKKQSRRFCKMHRSIVEQSEKSFQDGVVDGKPTQLEAKADSMWTGSKTSRFCQQRDLDRSGRVLSFLRTSEQQSGEFETSESSSTRRDVEQRMFEERGRDVVEVEHGVFSQFDGSDEIGDLGLGAGHAPITDTGNLVSRKIVRVRSVGKRHMYDLEVSNPTHNFILPNGIVTSNSHACAYTFISSRLLYLKAHYPLEFYTATLMCEKDQDKFREYKLDAKKHGIEVCPVDINKSRMNFNIAEDKIYFGFKNVKGIGEAVADRIVEGQPYKDFPDFLTKFGTDAAALMRLVALGVFDDLEPHYDREHLRKFHEFFKDKITKRRQRQQRFESSMEKKVEELRELLLSEIKEDDPDFEAMCKYDETAEKLWEERFEHIVKDVPYKYKGEDRIRQVSLAKIIGDLATKRSTSIRRFEENEKDDDENPMSMGGFNASSVKLTDEEIEILNDFMLVRDQKTYPKAESLYYGFQWNHELEASPDFKEDLTIDRFLEDCEIENLESGPIQIKINAIRKRTSKNGVVFYTVDFEDANSRQAKMNVWSDDYTRWQEELKKDALLSIRVRPPSGGFNTFTFESVPKHKRKDLPPKEEDFRLCVLATPPKPKQLDESDLMDFTYKEPAFIDLEDM